MTAKTTHIYAYTGPLGSDNQERLIPYDYQAPSRDWACGSLLTLAQLQEIHPSMQLMTVEEFAAANSAQYTTPPVEIDHAAFTDALYILWPIDYTTSHSAATFKWSERLTNTVTTIFARVNERYFKMTDRIDMPHGEIVAACKTAMGEPE